MIQIIIGGTFLGLFLLLSYLVFPVLWVMEKFNKKAKDELSLRIVQWGFRTILGIAGSVLSLIVMIYLGANMMGSFDYWFFKLLFPNLPL